MKKLSIKWVIAAWCIAGILFGLADQIHAHKHIIGIVFSNDPLFDITIKVLILFPSLVTFVYFIEKLSKHEADR